MMRMAMGTSPTSTTSTGMMPAFALSVFATRHRCQHPLSISSSRCCAMRTDPISCASRGSWRWPTIPRGRSSSTVSSMCFMRRCGFRPGRMLITRPGSSLSYGYGTSFRRNSVEGRGRRRIARLPRPRGLDRQSACALQRGIARVKWRRRKAMANKAEELVIESPNEGWAKNEG